MPESRPSVRLVRSATLLVRFQDSELLVDPMLDPEGARPPVPNSPNDRRNPTTPLPDVEIDPDGVLVTHTHDDHFDETARETLPKDLPVFCQPEDEGTIADAGFEDVRPVDGTDVWGTVEFVRTDGRHGTGEIGDEMAPVSGFVLRGEGTPTLYIAGDTVWCPEVAAALDEHAPDAVVVNAGAARFNEGDPITMTTDDVVDVCRHAPDARVVAVHMDAINHCLLTRAELRESLDREGLSDRTAVPDDGERIDV